MSLNIASGEWVFLVGASGMGKTTLLKLLYGEELADEGRVVIGGNDLAQISGSRLRRSMGIIFQSFRLLDKKTAFENIAYGAEVLGVPPAEVRRRTTEVLELVGLADKAHRLPGELSGGEQQRVAIGRALINQPRVILADEPTGDLDPENTDRVINILDRVHRERQATILFATHAVDVVNRLGRRVVRLQHGRVVNDATGGYWANGAAK
ncbi:MAG TPA: ATP-binding cassette domain-containing protein [Steroidobacteraceae bacterium]|nr:ATP-binding cassette domain-containing protein [Steroidobacteraceae bacterium]